MIAAKRIQPVNMDTRNRVVWKSFNLSLDSNTIMFRINIRNTAARNQISSVGSDMAKHANQSNVSCMEVLVVALSPNLEGNE